MQLSLLSSRVCLPLDRPVQLSHDEIEQLGLESRCGGAGALFESALKGQRAYHQR
jgi:hypothetical protein